MNDYVYIGMFMVLALLGWRLTECLRVTMGQGIRAQERDRRDYFGLIEKLLEKREVPTHENLPLAQVHSQERISRTCVDASVEKEVSKKSEPERKPDLVNTEDPLGSSMFS